MLIGQKFWGWQVTRRATLTRINPPQFVSVGICFQNTVKNLLHIYIFYCLPTVWPLQGSPSFWDRMSEPYCRRAFGWCPSKSPLVLQMLQWLYTLLALDQECHLSPKSEVYLQKGRFASSGWSQRTSVCGGSPMRRTPRLSLDLTVLSWTQPLPLP